MRQIHSVEKDPADVDTPISVAVDLQSLRQSENPLEKSSAEIISMLQDLRSKIGEVIDVPKRSRIPPMIFEELLMFFDRLTSVLELKEGEEPSRAKLEEAQHLLHRFDRMLHMLMVESGMPPEMAEEFMMRRLRRRRSE